MGVPRRENTDDQDSGENSLIQVRSRVFNIRSGAFILDDQGEETEETFLDRVGEPEDGDQIQCGDRIYKVGNALGGSSWEWATHTERSFNIESVLVEVE